MTALQLQSIHIKLQPNQLFNVDCYSNYKSNLNITAGNVLCFRKPSSSNLLNRRTQKTMLKGLNTTASASSQGLLTAGPHAQTAMGSSSPQRATCRPLSRARKRPAGQLPENPETSHHSRVYVRVPGVFYTQSSYRAD